MGEIKVSRVQETAKLKSGGDRAECAQDSMSNMGWQEEFGCRKEEMSKRQFLRTRYNEQRGSDFTLKASGTLKMILSTSKEGSQWLWEETHTSCDLKCQNQRLKLEMRVHLKYIQRVIFILYREITIKLIMGPKLHLVCPWNNHICSA